MKFRQTTKEDIAYIRSNPFDETIKSYPPIIPAGDCVTCIHDDKIWAVWGMFTLWEGVGEFWLMLPSNFKEIVTGYRAVSEMKKFIDSRMLKLFRGQAVVRHDYKKAIEMVEFLGFTRDGLMRNYLPNKIDAYMYSRRPNGNER